MLAQAGAADVLLAYQPVGPKAFRLAALMAKYPETKFSCLIDNFETARRISQIFEQSNRTIPVFIDLNIGMNRTGIVPEKALKLYVACQNLRGIHIIGLHAYDGHLRDKDLQQRTKDCDEAFAKVESLAIDIRKQHAGLLVVVAGGNTHLPYSCQKRRC